MLGAHPARLRRRPARRVLRGRRRRGRDGHVRGVRDRRWRSTASPTGPTRSTSPRPASPARWRRLRDRRPAALGRRLDGPRHEAPVARPDPLRRRCATRTRSRRAACSTAASTSCSSRRVYDLLQAEGGNDRRAGGRWPPSGRQVPMQLQVTMETTGRMLRRHRDRRRARLARRAASPTSSGSTAPPARAR